MSNIRKIASRVALAALLGTSALGGTAFAASSTMNADKPAAQTATTTQKAQATPAKKQEQQPKAQQEQAAALEVESQPVKDGTLNIDLAYMPQPGFVALHTVSQNGISPDTIGHAALKAGENRNVQVKLDGKVADNATLVAMLHQDTGKSGQFEFTSKEMKVDGPELIGGQPIAIPFQVTPAQPAGAQTN